MDGYTLFYGFSENPFKMDPDPRFFFWAETYQETLSSIINGIKERKGFTLITGEAGTGKTSLVQNLQQKLGEKVRVVIIDPTDLTIERILIKILLELGLPAKIRQKGALIHQLNETLLQMFSSGENLAIIIDGAHNLGKDTIEELRLLSNLETNIGKLLHIILVGQPPIEEKLNSKDLRQFKQRVEVKSRIRPLNEEECGKYIDHRLKLVGSSSGKIFTPAAIHLICLYGQGIPRNINSICDHTLQIGCSLSKRTIDAAIVKRTKKSYYKKISYTILMLAGLLGVIFLGGDYLKEKPKGGLSSPPIRHPIPAEKAVAPEPEMKTGTSSSDAAPEILENKQPGSPFLPLPQSPASANQPKAEKAGKMKITVEKGDTLASLSERYYKVVNATLIDQILTFNPAITNPHLIIEGQRILIPEITEDLPIIELSHQSYKIHLGTFTKADDARQFRNATALDGKEVEILPRQISPQETWYRVVAGKFENKEECLKTIRILKAKGVLPAFEAPPRN